MSPEIAATLVIGALVGFAGLVWWAKREGRIHAEIQADVAALEAGNEIKEKSREVSEAADSRRDPGLHDMPTIVPHVDIPAWLKRG